MIVYKDILTGDEMITDAFKHEPVVDEGEEIPGLIEVLSDTVTKGGDSVDIGCGNAFGGEGGDEGADDSVEKVNNIIDPFKYTEVPFGSKNDFKEYLKEYVRKIRTAMKEKGVDQPIIKEFMNQAPTFVKFLLSKYNDLQFYAGESMDPEGGMAFGLYKGEAHNPVFMYVSAGLVAEKF